MDFNNFKIAVGATGVDWFGNGEHGKLIPVRKYAEYVAFYNQVFRNEHPEGTENQNSEIKKQIEQDRIKHLLPPEEKWRATANFRDVRDHLNGKKLTDSHGNEMTMAQYHNMLYRENKEKQKTIIITENQLKRLFK